MIYDCFPFYNELTLLEMRLRELDGFVDKHILVESPTTHSGKPKPLWFDDNKERFAAWKDKIIHVVAELPGALPEDQSPRWVRENAQRDALRTGLEQANAHKGDVVLVSDADEIPRGSKVEEFVKLVQSGEPAGGMLRFYYYYLNGYRSYPWRSLLGLTVAACYRETPTNWRLAYMKRQRPFKSVAEAGWHFSFLGGADVVADKFGAYAHAEFDKMYFKSRVLIQKRIDAGVDPVERSGTKVTYIPLDNSFPRPVLAQPWKYAHMIRGLDVASSIYG
jgi:hypothetical protein